MVVLSSTFARRISGWNMVFFDERVASSGDSLKSFLMVWNVFFRSIIVSERMVRTVKE